MIFNSKRADIQSTELPVRWIVDSWRILEQERWAMYDSLQCGSFEPRAFLSHNQFCKSAQYLRSNRGLVLWIDSADSWAVIIFKHGVIHREWASSYVEKLEEVSTYKWDEWSSSDWSTARSSQISELAGFMRKVSLECFRTTLMLIMDLEEQPGHAESTRLRHRENEHRQNWRSNSFDFEREGARTFADSQWLGHIYRGCNLLYVRAIPRSLGKAQDAKGLMRGVSVASCFSVMSWFRVFLLGQTFGTGWEKVPNWECLVVHRKQGLFSSVHVDDITLTGRQQNVRPMWKKLMKNVDLGDATSFLDHVYLGCTQRECKPNENIIEEYTKMFESHISAGATEKWLGWEKLHGTSVAWSYDMDGQKHGESFIKFWSWCLGDHQFKQEEGESVRELSQVCSQSVLTCLYLARIEGPGIF